MPMCNLLEYSKNYRKTTGGFWNYYRDEPNSGIGGENIVNYSAKDSKSFDYKTSITGKKKCWNCCTIKIFKQVLENTRYAIN